jgi:regulator of sigma E protease
MAEAGLRQSDVIQEINGRKYANSAGFVEALHSLSGEDINLTVLRSSNGTVYDTTEQISLSAAFDQPRPVERPYILVIDIAPGSPAEIAGITPEDLIADFNGVPLQSFEDLQARVQENLEKEITLTIERDGETRDATLVPRSNPPEGEGSMGIVLSSIPAYGDTGSGLIYQEGFPQETYVPLSFGESVQFSLNQIGTVISLMAEAPARLIQGTLSPEEARPVSPVGISQMGGMVLQQSIQEERALPILRYIAVISIALGITNLLPIPALDGGRIIFVLLEIIRGRPIPPEREGMVHLVGLMLLLLATGFFVLNDIINPITNALR